jgi:hypothetical protein
MENTRTAHLGVAAKNPAAAQTKHVDGQSALARHESTLLSLRRKKMKEKSNSKIERRENKT